MQKNSSDVCIYRLNIYMTFFLHYFLFAQWRWDLAVRNALLLKLVRLQCRNKCQLVYLPRSGCCLTQTKTPGDHKVASGASTARGQTQISWTISPKITHFSSKFSTEIFIIEREKKSVKGTELLWQTQTQTVHDRHRLSMTDRYSPNRHRLYMTDTETPNLRSFVAKKLQQYTHFHGQFFPKNLCSRTKNILWKPVA